MNDTYPEHFGVGLTLTIDENKSAFFQLFSYKYCGWGGDFHVSYKLAQFLLRAHFQKSHKYSSIGK